MNYCYEDQYKNVIQVMNIKMHFLPVTIFLKITEVPSCLSFSDEKGILQ